MPKKSLSPFFIKSTLLSLEKFLFKGVMLLTKDRDYGRNFALNYLFHLRIECNKMIDIVSMKNNKREIFKYLEDIENSGE